MKLKLLTLVYIAFLASIIVAADRGAFRPFFTAVNQIPLADKLGHFILMGTFALLLNASLGWRRTKIAFGAVLLGTVIALSLVTMEECSQIFFKTRTFDLWDLTADYLGIFTLSQVAVSQRRNASDSG